MLMICGRSAGVACLPEVRAAISRRTSSLAGWPTFSKAGTVTVSCVFRRRRAVAFYFDIVFAAFARREDARVHAPFNVLWSEIERLGGAAWRGERDGDFAFGNRDAELVEDGRVEADFVAAPGRFRGVEKADAFILREVALVGHPAHDLPSEAVVVSVFDAFAPAPRDVVPMKSTLPLPALRVTSSGMRPC